MREIGQKKNVCGTMGKCSGPGDPTILWNDPENIWKPQRSQRHMLAGKGFSFYSFYGPIMHQRFPKVIRVAAAAPSSTSYPQITTTSPLPPI